jgi:hypothetical protein
MKVMRKSRRDGIAVTGWPLLPSQRSGRASEAPQRGHPPGSVGPDLSGIKRWIRIRLLRLRKLTTKAASFRHAAFPGHPTPRAGHQKATTPIDRCACGLYHHVPYPRKARCRDERRDHGK